MVNYLISLDLLPQALSNNFGQEKLLNELGDPYELRTKGLDQQLEPHQFGRILLHFVARRGFLSSKKQVAGDLVDDPDTQTYLSTLDSKQTKDEEGQFKVDIAKVYQAIKVNHFRTLGEYLCLI
jgi:CRISPR-associated endonuclease Csn1